MPLAAVAGIGLAGSIGGALIGSNAAGNAADAQTAAANHAADLQHQDSQAALDFEKQQYQTSQQQQAPWLQAGQTALGQLSQGTAPGGSLVTPYGQQFQAPTGLTMQNDPGFQARLQLGTDTLQKSAAARGSVLTGATGKALDTYAQDYASNEYGNVYNRALQSYDTNFNAYNTGQTNQFNRLAALSGEGQTTAAQLGQQGQAASNNITQNLLTSGQQQGQQLNNAAAATASGYVGGANAWNGALSGVGNNLTNLYALSQLGGGGYGSGVPTSISRQLTGSY